MKNFKAKYRRGLVLILTALFLASCGSSKVQTSKKVLKGYWNLDEINYGDAQGIYDVTLFRDATTSCFVGSTWRFIPNNSFGNYQINNGDNCTPKTQYFVWSIDEDGTATNYDILLKPTDEKMNSTMSNQGFRLNINYLSDNSLQFTQTVEVGDKPFTVIMNFSKIQE